LKTLKSCFSQVEASLKKGMTTHSTILAWRIPFLLQSRLVGYTVHGVAKS